MRVLTGLRPVLLAATLPTLVLSGAVGRASPQAEPPRRPSASAPAPAAAVAYRPPLSGAWRVVRGFEPPPAPYAAGHRGVDVVTVAGQAVVAAGAGRVTFAGAVAGRGVVVIAHADGVSTEYEPVAPAVGRGVTVRAGQVIGTIAGAHGSCAPGRCLHWGARRGGVYFDPLTLLWPLGPVRLLPWPR